MCVQANPRMTLFTGSSRVAEKLAEDLKGRVKLEDAGFDWKILGPDVQEVYFDCAQTLSLMCALLHLKYIAIGGRKTMLRGFAIKMLMHAVDRNALHSLFYSCTR